MHCFASRDLDRVLDSVTTGPGANLICTQQFLGFASARECLTLAKHTLDADLTIHRFTDMYLETSQQSALREDG